MILPPCYRCKSQPCKYGVVWDSINAKRDYGWDANPLVWVLGINPAKAGKEK